MKAKLTDVALRSYKPRDVQYSIGDVACPGLCIRITPKDVKSFAYASRDRTTGKVVWLTIGRYPDAAGQSARDRERRPQDRRQWRHAARAQEPARRLRKD
jgi:hypothetical protein